MYVELDGAWHLIGDDEHTECGIVIPQATLWTRELPERIHCGPDATKPKAEPAPPPEPAPKAKKK